MKTAESTEFDLEPLDEKVNDTLIQKSNTEQYSRSLLVYKCARVSVVFIFQTSWYTIDGEKFEARPIHVRILRNKIRVFCPPT